MQMQVHENIPVMGGLDPDAPSRRERLAREGERAQREISALLMRARGRARALLGRRALLVLLAGLSLALLAGALLASVDGTLFARLVLAGLSLLAAAGGAWLSLRSRLDPRSLARVLGGPSELLSSVELSRDPPPGASLELLSLLHVPAADAALHIDPARALPASSLLRPFPPLALCGLLWIAASLIAPRHVSQGLLRLRSGDSGAPPVEPSPIAGDLSLTYLYPAYTDLPPSPELATPAALRAPP